MSDVDKIVVIGGGMAAGRATQTLRRMGWDGELTVVTDEDHPPYERPPLSKELLLQADSPVESAYVNPEKWYAEHHVDLRTATRALGIDLPSSTVTIDDAKIPFDRLLIATGSDPRALPREVLTTPPGAALTYLRSIEHSLSIRSRLASGGHVVLVGGGWIAMEVAAAARSAGCDVTVLERGDLPLAGSIGSEVAQRFADLHRRRGVDVRVGTKVDAIDAGDQRAEILLAGGERLTADLVVVGVGARPRTDLASAAGLAVSDGVDADRFLRTSAHDVFVAGDVANPFNPRYDRHLRVEHWDNALHQGELAANNMISTPQVYDRTPYFFTDQFDLGMEMCGYIPPGVTHETVIRGDLASDTFTVFWVRDGRAAAGLHVNDWNSMKHIRRIVETGIQVDPTALADLKVGLDHQASM